LLVPGGLALSDSERTEALADSLEAKFQAVNDLSSLAVIEAVDEAKRAYEHAPASEPKLTIPCEVQDAIKGFKADNAPCPKGVQNRPLKRLPKRAI
jgi:hypothetical protein